MKISQMTNEQAADALVKITVPLGNICEDEKTTELFNQYNELKTMPLVNAIGKILPQIVAHLLETHKEDVYQIVGALLFKSKGEVAKLNFFETVSAVKDSYDEVLQGFFTSYANQTKESEGK